MKPKNDPDVATASELNLDEFGVWHVRVFDPIPISEISLL